MAIKTGKFTDTRDGHVYRTVLMPDGKWWFAENLAWAGVGMDYANDPANRVVYGRLYIWADAIVACPSGTEIPSKDYWQNLKTIIGEPSGTKLKSSDLWIAGAGTDDYKFTIKPCGWRFPNGDFSSVTNGTQIWAMTAGVMGFHYCVYFGAGYTNMYISTQSDKYSFAIRPIVISGNIPDFLPEDHLPEQITLEPISVHSQFKAYSGTVRTLNGSGGTYFVANSTYKMELTSEEYTAFDEWWKNSVHFGEIPFQIPNFPLGKIGMAVQLIALPSVTQTHSGYSVSLKAQFKSSDTIGGIYNTTCPFKLLELSGNQFQVSQTFIATGGVSTARTPLNRRGIRMSLGFIGNGDEMAQLIEWFRFGIGNGSKMFKASTDSKINWLWKLTSMPKFTMKGTLGSATFEVLGREP